MRLIETWLADPERAFDLFAKFPAEETGFENPAAGMDREQFAAYVRGLRDESLGVGLPDGWVPATKYILVNDEGDYVASSTCVTGSPTPTQRSGPHRLRYRPRIPRPRLRDRRAQAHARQARELGIEEAYLSVHKTNPASLAVQQHCGARIDHEDKTEYYTRIATCMESDGLYARGD